MAKKSVARTLSALRQAQGEEIRGRMNADGTKKSPHAEPVEARTILIQLVLSEIYMR
jgi:hypothetical protein